MSFVCVLRSSPYASWSFAFCVRVVPAFSGPDIWSTISGPANGYSVYVLSRLLKIFMRYRL